MYLNSSGIDNTNFIQWAVRKEYQKFIIPDSVELPPEAVVNGRGWIQCPTSGDLLIPIFQIRPDENKTVYYYQERIDTTSSSDLEIVLEGNVTWDESIGDFDPNGWFVQNAYVVNSVKSYHAPDLFIKQKAGEAQRLRVFSASGNNNNFYFKFFAVELPFVD